MDKVLTKRLNSKNSLNLEQTMTFAKQILPFLPRAMPDYTDHGVQHSLNLIEIFEKFYNNLQKQGFSISEEEEYLIQLSIWIHDLGIIITKEKNKKKHNENTIKILESREFVFLEDMLGKDTFRRLKFLAKFHSSNTDLNLVPLRDSNIRLRLICAIFRLIDGCDITSARVARVLYNILIAHELLKSSSIPYWQAHIAINNAKFQDDRLIVDCYDEHQAELLTKHLAEDLEPINGVFKQEGMPEFTFELVEDPLKITEDCDEGEIKKDDYGGSSVCATDVI